MQLLKTIIALSLFFSPLACLAAWSPGRVITAPTVVTQPNVIQVATSTPVVKVTTEVPSGPAIPVGSSGVSSVSSANNANIPAPEASVSAVAPSTGGVNIAAPNPAAVNGIVIINPVGGEEFQMNGATLSIYFKYFGLDPKLEGQLKFQVDLLQGDKVLGPVAGMYLYNLDIAKGYESLGFMSGWYTDLAKKETIQVAPGDNFRLKVKILNGGNMVMSAISNEFSFIPNQTPTPALSLKVMSPNGGEEYIEDGKVISGYYDYAGLDTNTLGGTYISKIELWRNGKRIGPLFNTDFSESPWANESNFGFQSGVYYDEVAKDQKVVEPGTGYKIKVTIFKNGQPIISDESDAPFSFKAGPAYNETPIASVLLPGLGDKFIIGEDNRMQVAFSGFNPYDNGKLHYELSLYKSGQKLGKIGLDWLTDMVNVAKPTEDDYDQFERYYDKGQKQYVSIAPGSDYQIGIDVYRYQDLMLNSQLSPKFSIIRKGTVINAINGLLGREAKVIVPEEVKTAVYQVVNSNQDIKSVKVVSSTQFELKYREKAKLLGFIPVKYDLKVTADLANKKTAVKTPWWLFLTANDAPAIANESQTALNSLDTFSGLTEENQLRLQMKMDRYQQTISTLSNILKKISSTTESITSNIK